MCCAQEEALIHRHLDNLKGVEKVGVNLIGRYAIVKHCCIECCAPSSLILSILNDQRLGASVQEVGDSTEEGEEEKINWRKLNFVGLIGLLFFAGRYC